VCVPGTGSLSTEPVDLDAVILSWSRCGASRNGTGAPARCRGGRGDTGGTARIVAWEPGLFAGLSAGMTVHITNAKPGGRGEGRDYSIDAKSTVTPAELEVAVPFTPLHSVADQGFTR